MDSFKIFFWANTSDFKAEHMQKLVNYTRRKSKEIHIGVRFCVYPHSFIYLFVLVYLFI